MLAPTHCKVQIDDKLTCRQHVADIFQVRVPLLAVASSALLELFAITCHHHHHQPSSAVEVVGETSSSSPVSKKLGVDVHLAQVTVGNLGWL